MTTEVRGPRKKWSYKSVGKTIGVSETMVSLYLRGFKYPSLMVMRRIERVYEWPLIEQIGCLPDQGHDKRYAEQFRWWLGEQ